MAAIRLRQRQSLTMNHWLRARVVLQGVTVAAMMWSMYDFGRTDLKTREDGEVKGKWEVLEQESKDDKKEKERRGFEERLRQAEDAHLSEKGSESVRGMQKHEPEPAPSGRRGSSWRWWPW
jgi:hypothetical protein